MGETLYSGGLALALGMRLWYRWMTRQRVVTRSAIGLSHLAPREDRKNTR